MVPAKIPRDHEADGSHVEFRQDRKSKVEIVSMPIVEGDENRIWRQIAVVKKRVCELLKRDRVVVLAQISELPFELCRAHSLAEQRIILRKTWRENVVIDQ